MIIETILKVSVSIIGEAIWQEVVVSGVAARFKEEIVRKKIAVAINVSLSEALAEIPGFESDIDEITLTSFLRSPTVLRELSKTVSVFDGYPNIILLRDEWLKKFQRVSAGKVEILLTVFLNKLKKKIHEITELHEVLYRKKSLDDLAHIKSSVDTLQSHFTQFTENQLEPIDSKSDEELELQSRLNTYRELIRKGLPKSSLSLLQDAEKEIASKNFSNQLRSQCQGLLGFCYYLLNDFKEAIKRFENALILNSENPKALANAALAALLDNRLDDAIQRATKSLENNGKDTPARAILVNALAIKRNFNNIEDLIEEDGFNNVDYVRALGHIFFQAKQYDLAEKYYRLSLAQHPSDFHSLLGLASVLGNSSKTPFRLLTKKEIDEAMELITTAVKIAELGDNDFLKAQGIAARSGILLAKHNLQEAKRDCEDVLEKFPDNEIALHNRSIIAFLENDYKTSVGRLSNLSEDYIIRNNLVSLLVMSEIFDQMPDKAIETITRFSQMLNTSEQLTLKSLQAKALLKLNKNDDAQKIKEELLISGREAQALLGAAEISEAQGKYLEAIDILETAYNERKNNESDKTEIALALAMITYHHKDFDKSIYWFRLLPKEFLCNTELAHKYINALFLTKKYGEACRALREAREFGVHSSSLIELEAWLAEYLGDRNLAIKLQKELIEIESSKVNHRVQLARLEFLNKQVDQARSTLGSIDTSTITDPSTLIQIAEMLSYIGENQNSIQIAYKARKLGSNNPDVHIAYIALFTRIEDEINHLLNTNTVQPDSAVLLSSTEKKQWVKLPVIVEPSGDWEFSPESDQGKLLLGHKKGDVVEFKSSPFETLSYTIQEVQSLYVRAYQESFEEFSTRFPKHDGLHKMDIADGDLSKIFIPLYRKNHYFDQMYSYYEQGQIPIGMIAHMTHSSQLEVFTSFQAYKNNLIIASHGSTADQQSQTEALAKALSITLDITSLLTLSYLELLPILKQRYKNIFIHQSLIDEIEGLIIKRQFELKKGARYIGYHDHRPYFEEISPNSIERNMDFLRNLENYLRENCVITAIPAEVAEQSLIPDEIKDGIDHLSISTILIAKHTNTPLLADDACLRLIANHTLGVAGAWSQVLLHDAKEKNIINLHQYAEACAKLLILNYSFVSVNSKMIMSLIEKSTYTVSDEMVDAILIGLRGPKADEELSIKIAAETLKDVWLSSATHDRKIFILDGILRNLYKGRERESTTSKLLHVLRPHFIAALDKYDTLSRQIKLYYDVGRLTN